MFRDIWRVRELLYTLVRRDLIVRYQSSVLGFFWSFAKPLALVLIFHLAFRVILRLDTPDPRVPFALHLLVGVLVWSFFSRCLAEGHWSVLSHANLIKKVKIPIEIFPTVTVAGNLINFLLAIVVVFPAILIVLSASDGFEWVRIGIQFLLTVGLTLLLCLLALSITLLVSALNVFYRDTESLTEVGLTAWFYATPIVYSMDLFLSKQDEIAMWGGGWGRWLVRLYWLNPMTPICLAYRRILLYREGVECADTQLLLYLGISVCVSVVLYVAGLLVFRHYAERFADEV